MIVIYFEKILNDDEVWLRSSRYWLFGIFFGVFEGLSSWYLVMFINCGFWCIIVYYFGIIVGVC